MANHVYPVLQYRDPGAAIDFLERAFGFELINSHTSDDGTIGYVQMRWGDSPVEFGPETDLGIERFGSHSGKGWIYVTVDDPDAHHERAKAAGAAIAMELADQDYGSRDYSARDPEGNLWSFGTYDPLK